MQKNLYEVSIRDEQGNFEDISVVGEDPIEATKAAYAGITDLGYDPQDWEVVRLEYQDIVYVEEQ